MLYYDWFLLNEFLWTEKSTQKQDSLEFEWRLEHNSRKLFPVLLKLLL
jgi:hypothetical protein